MTALHAQDDPEAETGGAFLRAEDLASVIDRVRLDGQTDLSDYRDATLRRQLQRRMAELGLTRVADYLARLAEDADEVCRLRQAMLVSVTGFFRDEAVFEALTRLLREWLSARGSDEPLRIWVCGCATGEEAYSVAMLVDELRTELGSRVPARIFATDLDRAAVAVARAGAYGAAAVAVLEPARRQRHFRPQDESWVVAKAVRDLCVFAEHDVLSQPAFVNLDLVLCRNVLIYVRPEARQQVLQRFARALRPGGQLLLGLSETLAADDPGFVATARAVRLYGRRLPASARELARGRATAADAGVATGLSDGVAAAGEPWTALELGRRRRLQAALLQRDALPSVLVDGQGQVLQLHGAVEPWLRLGTGPDLTLGNLLPVPLREEARALLNLARGTVGRQQSSPRLWLDDGRALQLLAQALPPSSAQEEPELLLSFRSLAVPARAGEAATGPASDEAVSAVAVGGEGLDTRQARDARHEIEALRAELALAREQLHTLAREQERSEAGRRRALEELHASTEELQAANEELQASNEELISLNEQLTAQSAELRDFNEQLLGIERATGQAVVVVDTRLCVRRHNPQAQRIFGLLPGDIGRPLLVLPASLPLERLPEQLGRVLSEGRALVDRISQGERHYVLQLAPLRDRHELVSGVVLSFSDVSALRQAEIEGARLAAIVRGSTDAIVGKTLQGLITSWNPGAERLFGHPAEEAVGQSMLMVFPPELRHQEAELLARVARGETVQPFDTVRLRRDGQRVHVSVTLSPIHDAEGRIVGVSKIARDISDRVADSALRQAAHERLETLVDERTRALADSERFAQDILQGLPGWVGYWDRTLQPRLSNAALQALQRVALQRPSGPVAELARRLDPVREPQAQAAVARVLTGEAVDYELGPISPSMAMPIDAAAEAAEAALGAAALPRHLRVSLQPHRRGDQIAGFILQAVDISPIRQAQAAEAAANRAKSDFLASISHEIRTPMNAVLGLAQVGSHLPAEPATRQVFDRILQAGRHLLDLINDVLDFSRIEAGKMVLDLGEVDLAALLSRVQDLLGPQARDKGLRLVVERAADLPAVVLGDGMRLAQLLINLLGNAVKFTDSGEVRLQLRRDGAGLVLEVSDTGPGLDPALLSRLFQPFERARSGPTRRAGGSGLGLAICHRLVELMEGDLRARSTPGQGACFSVWLPLRLPEGVGADVAPSRAPVSAGAACEAPAAAVAQAARSLPRLAGLRVLVVEDNPINTLVLEELLRIEGAHPVCVDDGAQALTWLAQADLTAAGTPPSAASGAGVDLVLCDVEMPVMDGYEATRRIRVRWPALPVIGLTAHAFAEARERARIAGMAGYLVKPLMLDALVAEIRRVRAEPPA